MKDCTQEQADFISRLTDGKARTAVSLLRFNPYFEKTVKSVFGDVIVCDDEETALKLAYHPKIMMRCVSIDGSLYDPDGAITGGKDLNKNNSILNRI